VLSIIVSSRTSSSSCSPTSSSSSPDSQMDNDEDCEDADETVLITDYSQDQCTRKDHQKFEPNT
jgi:hypothetical protein